MYTTWKVEWIELQDSGVHSSTAVTIDESYDINFRTNTGSGRDVFSFKVRNVNGTYDDYFNVGDRVTLSRIVDSSTLASSDILVNGTITNVPTDQDGDKSFIKIEGSNYTETLMQALAFVSADGLTIPAFFQQALSSVNTNNPNFQVTWAAGNPSVKTDGSAFPTVDERWNYKSILQLIEKYSSIKYTEDVNYFFYVNVDNELVWQPRESSASATFTESTGLHKMLKVRKDKSGVINFVIAKGHNSPAGEPISTFVQNSPSMAKHGFKPKLMISQANYVKSLSDQDRTLANFDEGDTNPNTYNFTTAWSSLVNGSSPTMVIGSTVTVTSADEYNIAIKRQVKALLKKDAQVLLDEFDNGKMQVQLDFSPGDVSWGLGDVLSVTIPQAGKANDFMRVTEVNYHSNSDSFVLEEDEGTV